MTSLQARTKQYGRNIMVYGRYAKPQIILELRYILLHFSNN